MVIEVVVHPGTTQRVNVSWPMLTTNEFEKLLGQGMLWEFSGNELHMQGGVDASCAQLVGGIAPLRMGKQARARQNVLFHNPGEKMMTILAGDVVGHARLAGQGQLNPAWLQAMQSHNLIHSVGTEQVVGRESTHEWTQQLVKQLGIMDNRLLMQYPQVRSKLTSLITCYESVFTDSDVAVGKTDVLKMKIV